MFFDLDAYERFRMNKEERALYDEAHKKDAADTVAQKKGPAIKFRKWNTKKNRAAEKNEDKSKGVKPLKLDLANCRDRVLRLTVNSSHLADDPLARW